MFLLLKNIIDDRTKFKISCEMMKGSKFAYSLRFILLIHRLKGERTGHKRIPTQGDQKDFLDQSLSPKAKELAQSDSQRKVDTPGVPMVGFSRTKKKHKDLQDQSLSPKDERTGPK